MSAPITARWYCVSADGLATLCKDEADAIANAKGADVLHQRHAPHRAVLLGDVAAERERCAQVCESIPAHRWADGSDQFGNPCPAKVVTTPSMCADMIRKGDAA